MQAAALNSMHKAGYVRRFNTRQIIEHIVLMIIFTGLAITGIIQRFYATAICNWIILHIGGIETTRLIHRGLAMAFTAMLVYHFVFCMILIFGKHQKATMVPTLIDYKGIVADLKCNMGLANSCPKFGRFDYRQKFEYFGMIFGSVIITITGFMLMFPTVVTNWLPGQAIPIALTFHGWEATLAVLVILVWHIYDTVLRPDIFPTDKSIFNGKLSIEREMEEHTAEYEEMTGKKVD
jgi:formate dehydrogenase subunit gamma